MFFRELKVLEEDSLKAKLLEKFMASTRKANERRQLRSLVTPPPRQSSGFISGLGRHLPHLSKASTPASPFLNNNIQFSIAYQILLN